MGEAKRRKKSGNYRAVQEASRATEIAPLPEPPIWALTDQGLYAALVARFAAIGVDSSHPAFHDSESFLLAENVDPRILNDYARFVEARPYSETELREAYSKITIAASVVSEAVRLDGRPGLCVTASGVLSRILDAWGVWNYTPKATLTVTFPPQLSREPRFFWVLDEGNFAAAHAFVVAPPFVIIDATVRYQHWSPPRLGNELPPLVLQQTHQPYTWVDEDIANEELRALLDYRRTTMQEFLNARCPHMLKVMSQLPGRLARYPGGELRYVVTSVGGYKEQLRELTHHCALNKQMPTELFAECIAKLERQCFPLPLKEPK